VGFSAATLIQSTGEDFDFFNPFLESHNQLIPPAKYDGTVLKLNGYLGRL
jgi:hypothetical protein